MKKLCSQVRLCFNLILGRKNRHIVHGDRTIWGWGKFLLLNFVLLRSIQKI